MNQNHRLIRSIFAIGILSFLGIVIETALNIAFPQLMMEFHLGPATIQWLTTGYMLVSTVIVPFGSYLRKRFRAVGLFRAAVFSFLLGTICAAVANNFTLLLYGRLLQGVANGISLPLMFSIILEQASKKKVGTFMGIGTLVIAFAPAVGPVYGGIVVNYLPWQALFAFIIPVIIATWLLGETSISQTVKSQKIPFDYQGAVTLAIFLVSTLFLILGFTSHNKILLQLILALLALSSGSLFVYLERKKPHALLDMTLFKRKHFDLFLTAFFLLQLLSLSMSFLIPNVLQMTFKQSTATAGLLILPAAIVDALVSAIAGVIYDKANPRLPIIIGVGIITATFLVAQVVKPSVISLVAIYIIFMLGLGLSYSNIMTLSLEQLSSASTNDGNVLYMTAQSYSGAIGTALAASLLGWAQAKVSSQELGTLNGLKLNLVVLLVIGLIILCCILAEAFLKRVAKD